MTQKTFTYAGSLTRQRDGDAAPRLFVFQARPEEVLEWAFVDRLDWNNTAGTQRAINKRKVKDVSRFFTADARNIIPTAVVVAIKSDSQVSIQPMVEPAGIAIVAITCEVPDPQTAVASSYPALVIDGQHRLLGMKAASQDLVVNVVALLDASQEEIAFQFLVINNKASKVDKKHLANLALNYQQNELNERLQGSAGIGLSSTAISVLDAAAFDEQSPFFQMVAMPASQERIVMPSALELAYEFVAASTPSSVEVDDRVWFFLFIWKAIRETWEPGHPRLWGRDSKLLSKVGIVCFTQFMVGTFSSLATIMIPPPDLRDEDQVKEVAVKILDKFDPEFFEAIWKRTELDTKAGRELLLEAINKSASNVRYGQPWFHEVQLIDPASVA